MHTNTACKAVANSNADLDIALKIVRGRLFVHEKMIWTTENITRDGGVCSLKILERPKKEQRRTSLEAEIPLTTV